MNETTQALLAPQQAQQGMTRGIARQEIAATEIDTSQNASAQSLATRARAEVEAAIMVAKRFPRDLDEFRVKVLKACRRPRFAEVAWYKKPQGRVKNDATGQWEQNYVEGLSVRFAEEAYRELRNLDSGTIPLYEDDAVRVLNVYVADLESNVRRSEIVTVAKTVERKKLNKGQSAIRSRTNSSGEVVHIVEATDDEVAQKQGALVSKAWRNLVNKMVPGDVLDEAREAIIATRANETATDPDAARKRMADAFASVGVTPAMLREVLGHDLATCSPSEIETLRGWFAGIKTGETNWTEIAKSANGSDDGAEDAKPAAKSTRDLVTSAQQSTSK